MSITAEFCRKNYGVTFPMAAKVSVKGKSMAPIYQWLTQKKYENCWGVGRHVLGSQIFDYW